MQRVLPASLLCLTLLIGLASSGPAAAQQTVEYPALGLRFDVPVGWQGQEGDDMYLIQSSRDAATFVLMAHEATTLDALRAGAQEGIDAGGGSSLRLHGDVRPFGASGVRADMAGIVEWMPAEAHAIGLLSPYGKGVTVIGLAPLGQFTDAHRSMAEALATSVEFSEPIEPPVVQQWREGLLYRQLAKYNTNTVSDGSSSERLTLTLCDGAFSRYVSYSYYRTGAGGHSDAGANTEYGTWEVVSDGGAGALLVLTYDTGEEVSYELTFEDDKIYLDDTRYLQSEGSCE